MSIPESLLSIPTCTWYILEAKTDEPLFTLQMVTTLLLKLLVCLVIIVNIVAERFPWRHVCSKEEARFQTDNLDFANPKICDSELGWAFAQLHIPDATVFLDVGANLGFTAAMIFGLWSPGHSITMKTLHEVLGVEKPKSRNSHDGTSTYCGDGIARSLAEYPLTCIGAYPNYDSKPAPSNDINTPLWCSTRNNIHVYSFDGERNHSININNVIGKYFSMFNYKSLKNTTKMGKILTDMEMSQLQQPFWSYNHMAVTPPLAGNPTEGYFEQTGHEGSHFVPGKPPPHVVNNLKTPVILVPVTTIDKFCEERNITKVDVFKMDVEGLEPEVIKGAVETLQNR